MRISCIFNRTRTECLMIIRITLSVNATNVNFTRVDAKALDAFLVIVAVGIDVTLLFDVDDCFASSIRICIGVWWTLTHNRSKR